MHVAVAIPPLSRMEPPPYIGRHGHSQEEQRFLLLGRSASGRLLIVAHSEEGERLRIISARAMTPKERRSYERSPEF